MKTRDIYIAIGSTLGSIDKDLSLAISKALEISDYEFALELVEVNIQIKYSTELDFMYFLISHLKQEKKEFVDMLS
jgi:hypothetical protein